MNKYHSTFTLQIAAITLILSGMLTSCNNSDSLIYLKYAGYAQGTTFNIKYIKKDATSYQSEIDSILESIDNSISIYNSKSIIFLANSGDTSIVLDDYFIDVFQRSIEVAERTDGAFDPTVAPLVNAWGFGYKEDNTKPDSVTIDSILKFVNYKFVRLKNKKLIKTSPIHPPPSLGADLESGVGGEVTLDFNAIAQGYTVDIISGFFEKMGVENYMVELGGEIRSKGRNQNSEWWRIGIDKPIENLEEREIHAVIELKDKSLATSGNYRKFYEKNGIKYSHTIDPKTGYPVRHSLLSATIIANDCMTADAYATAFMVMGITKAKEFLIENPDLNLEVYFIYSGENGEWKVYYSKGFEGIIKEL
ncbi:MAG: FAD:protein FMN transferase [Bacteroidota bacterium]